MRTACAAVSRAGRGSRRSASYGRHPLAALTLVVVLVTASLTAQVAARTASQLGPTDEPLAFAPVPGAGASVRVAASLPRPLPTVRPTSDPVPPPSVPVRPVVPVPTPRLIVVATGGNGSGTTGLANSVRGIASWYCGHGSACTKGYGPDCLCAAAGPSLRVGQWRGRRVAVSANGRSVTVTLVDWCLCTGGSGRVLDLYRAAFSRLADPSRGLVNVKVTW